MSEKRSPPAEIAQGDLFGDGVGARHGSDPAQALGGEYLNNCALPNFSTLKPAPNKKNAGAAPRDPRFAELEKIGIPSAWMRVAERVGFDAWLDIWRMLSSDESVRHDGGARMPKLRCYSAYTRFQRNAYIRSLADQGMPPVVIQSSVRNNLGEYLDISHITRIARKRRSGALSDAETE